MSENDHELDLSMKLWWGWGHNVDYDIFKEHPNFWPWLRESKTLDIKVERDTPGIAREDLFIPTPKQRPDLIKALQQKLRDEQISQDDDVRLRHTYGKSFRDLYRMRTGVVKNPPDLVVFPQSDEDVQHIVNICYEHGAVIIPFGGGTNIVGSLEAIGCEEEFVISVDLKQMNHVLSIDEESLTARIEAGVLGPHLEEQLNEAGYALGHHPDSFIYSTLGGWVATRSAGQQSDAYGKIEDMVISVRMITHNGIFETRPLPASSVGPDLNHIMIGSEGIFGIITEVTMRIHPYPEYIEDQAILFRDFETGFHLIHDIAQSDDRPSMIRLLNQEISELSFSLSKPATGFKKMMKNLIKKYLSSKGFHRPCLMILGFEGKKAHAIATRKKVLAECRARGGFLLGKKAAAEWRSKRYLVPLLRDAIMNKGIAADVAETSTPWSNVLPLYHAAREAILKAEKKVDNKIWVGCHISHTYKTGCSLYFTFGSSYNENRGLEVYDTIKSAITDAIVKNGGALSHHHAVGYEHQPWIKIEIGEKGIETLRGLKESLDPENLFNPRKIILSRKTQT